MKIPRRQILHFAGAAAAASVLPRRASALDYPTKPVRVIVPFVPGGASDTIGRLISQRLSERLGQPFIVENRPGAGTNIATEAVVRAAPDGYTLLIVSTSGAVNATLYQKLSFKLDMAPVAGLFGSPLVMTVNPSFPTRTVPEFIAYAKGTRASSTTGRPAVGACPMSSPNCSK